MIILKTFFWVVATPCILISVGAVWLWVLWLIVKAVAERIRSWSY